MAGHVLGERAKMAKKYRVALTATVLTYIDTAKQLVSDPLSISRLPITGSVVLGGELGLRPKDSVYWQVIDPATCKPLKPIKLADDLSKWRKALNKQLKAWGQRSEVKRLATKRAIAGGVIAALVVAAVVATVLTFGGAGPAIGGAALAVTTTGEATVGVSTAGAAAIAGGTGGASSIGPVVKAIGQAAASGVVNAATAGLSEMSPNQAASLSQQAGADAKQQPIAGGEGAIDATEIAVIGLAVGGTGLGLFLLWRLSQRA